jgi:hypothetical protein
LKFFHDGSSPIRATLCWTDPVGTPPAESVDPLDLMLVNDLDLRLTHVGSTTYYPYVLDPANPSLAATTGDNIRDNVEQIHQVAPWGNYELEISHKGTLTGGSQTYSLILTGLAPYELTTLPVPGQFPSIQDAIENGFDFDIVLVFPGYYPENIDFLGKALIVRSTNPDNPTIVASTVIDGNQAGSVVTFDSGEGLDSVLEGFTITNGSGTLISNTTLGGGIICVNSSSPTIRKNILTENACGHGGGLYCLNSAPSVTDNLFSENSVQYFGGAVSTHFSTPSFSNNMVLNNTANNAAGFSFVFSTVVMANNIFSGNVAQSAGGALFCDSSTVTMTNDTISGNSADYSAAIECFYGSSMTITNTILWENATSSGNPVRLGPAPLPSSITVEQGSTLNWGAGMIDADPLFLDPQDDDFHLTRVSPCIEAGDNFAPSLPARDFEGDPRIFPRNGKGLPLLGSESPGAIVDMGADEYFLLKREKFVSK